jgi:transposase
MLGHKLKVFKPHTAISLDDLVPQNNFYRQVEAQLDLRFVRELVKDCYASGMGRPSIDPVTFFKLHLIMFFEGIRSERQLMEMVNLNLAYRWYIGYDLHEAVPDHSSLSKIRDRYGLDVFQQFFEQIVERCIAAGLVWGKELYFDGTKVRANAAVDAVETRLELVSKQHLETLFPEQADELQQPTSVPPRRLVDI